VLCAARVLASSNVHSKFISTFKKFLSIDLHISNYARHLLTIARFLALHFTHKSKFFSKKTCYNFVASLARAIPGATKFLPKRLYPAFNV